ncbi:hypothetical protein ACFFOM_09610 [Microlunatus capsulatus]|uniref:Uncharacterized protein n=1 Tax=Microlunatus capsulatus TaxID=99117 RepID=A0ABS4ZAJ6_9ACTN|nr:hypothetical protein [Microlunatus capsulatus]MBP2418009.1 hypothetical protein [Microlunatus capsulatus]
MHADPDLLALLALGEPAGTPEERLHVEACAVCAHELADFARVVDQGRRAPLDATLTTPGEQVWLSIRSDLGLTAPTQEPATEDGQDEDDLTGHAHLAPVEAVWADATGDAELATDERGRRILQVALHAELPTSGIRQAWLVHRHDPTRRQTLGILDGSHGLWTVDHSIDLAEFGILDISQQSPGETEHSGQTIVQGELTLAS